MAGDCADALLVIADVCMTCADSHVVRPARTTVSTAGRPLQPPADRTSGRWERSLGPYEQGVPMHPSTDPTPRRVRRVAAFAIAGVAGALAMTALATPAAAVPSSSGCAAVSIITARASTETAGEGITGNLVTAVVNASNQTVSRASVSYPATLNNYNSSSLQGIQAAKTQITNLVSSCPNTKIVLLGYSQGAHVMLDVLGGGQGGSLGTATPPLAANIASHVTVVATFGDPRHVPNQSFNLGTAN